MTKFRNNLLTFVLVTCLLAVWAPNVQAAHLLAATEHSGALAGNETWTTADNPHYINGPVTVPAGITLTLQSGVIIMGRSSSGILVNGRLVAKSSPGQEIVLTSALDNAAGQWAGLIFDGAAASGDLDGVWVRYGGGSMSGFTDPYRLGSVVFNNLAANAVQVQHSKISNGGGTAGWQIFNSNITQNGILNGNRIFNCVYGVNIDSASQVLMSNTAALDNSLAAIMVRGSSQITMLHTTLARNTYGLRVVNLSSASLTNSIIANNMQGVDTTGTVTLNRTLWDSNSMGDISGTVTNNSPFYGAAEFDPADGYHLTIYSQALNKGASTSFVTDIDGHSRPLPAGSLPDLGAAELDQSLSSVMTAEKLALPPVWINLPDAQGNPYGTLFQEYWIRLFYGSDQPSAPAVSVHVEDTLPTGFDFVSERHNPAMSFSADGQSLNWQTTQDLAPNQSVDIHMAMWDSDRPVAQGYTNTAVVTAGDRTFNLSAASAVDIFAPLIIWPYSGEICPLDDTSLDVSGSAQPGTTVEIYENNVKKGETLTNSSGLFSAHYLNSGVGIVENVALTARACKDGECSGTVTINLTPSQSFWCPMRSTWSATPIEGPMTGHHLSFGFRNASGSAATTGWSIEGIYGFQNTQLNIHACNCPASSGTTGRPESLWVVADGITYTANSSSVFPNYQFDIGSAHTVEFWAKCGQDGVDIKINGQVLIDPDGYVVDATQGFNPNNPTAHVLPGSTVTAMAYLPEWGGWVSWPAHLYNHQVNPQVVGANGYFAFFTPPGQYYLQVEGPSGYQSWRSPVVTVVNEIVHVNVPLTAITGGSLYTLQSNRAGLSQNELTIPVGARVRWEIGQSDQEDSTDLLADVVNPVLRLKSSLDPFSSPDGWDSGRLYPGQSYTRQFNQTGDYTYTDSAGHTALIRVIGQKIFIPCLYK